MPSSKSAITRRPIVFDEPGHQLCHVEIAPVPGRDYVAKPRPCSRARLRTDTNAIAPLWDMSETRPTAVGPPSSNAPVAAAAIRPATL